MNGGVQSHGTTSTLEAARAADHLETGDAAFSLPPGAAPEDLADGRWPGAQREQLVRRRRFNGFPELSGPVGWVGGQQITMLEWNLLTTLIGLELDPADFVVMGTGALISHGLPRQINDLDVLVQGAAWDTVKAHPEAEFVRGVVSGDEIVRLHGGLLEFSATWFGGSTAADIIARADLISFEDWGTSRELRFASLADSLRYKSELKRAKDIIDLKAILALSPLGLAA